jgi:hypothetical protein
VLLPRGDSTPTTGHRHYYWLNHKSCGVFCAEGFLVESSAGVGKPEEEVSINGVTVLVPSGMLIANPDKWMSDQNCLTTPL